MNTKVNMRVGCQIDLSEAAVDAIKTRVVRRVVASVCDDKVKADKAIGRMQRLANICVAQHGRDGRIGSTIAEVVEGELAREEVIQKGRLADAWIQW